MENISINIPVGRIADTSVKVRHMFVVYEIPGADYGHQSYIEHREIKDGVLGAGNPLTKSALVNLCSLTLPQLKKVAYSPESVISYAPACDFIMWWKPAGIQRLYFDKKLEIKNGTAPVPALLFAVQGRALYVWALKDNSRPDPDTEIYHAPFYNIYENSGVCMGNTKLPEHTAPESIHLWEKQFFDSAFSGDMIPRIEGTTGKLLWRRLIGSGKLRFPVKYLKKHSTLKKIITAFNSETTR